MFARLALFAAVFAASAWTQAAHDWASLGRAPAISSGALIEVKTTDRNQSRGQFQSADADALVIGTPNGEQRFARATVSRVSVKTPGHRGRNTLIGLGIGTAAGLSLGALADARCTGKCIEGNRPLGKEVGTPLGALIGALIGVLIPTGGWREVYRAP